MDRQPSLYSVIPARVRYDNELRPNAKLLYGELSALAMAEGYCWASNSYLAELFGLSANTVAALIKQLKDRGHIYVEVERSDETQEVIRRKIWICGPAGVCVPPPLKNEGRSPQKQGDPPLKNGEENNNSISNTSNIPPYNPPKGDKPRRAGRKRRAKAAPVWQAERFEGFWSAYPRDEDRAKAVEQWDQLGTDRELLEQHGGSEEALLTEIARGLKRHLESEDWQAGVGIPYAFRWLRDRKWTEKKKTGGGQGRAAPSPEGARIVEEEGTYLL